MSENQLILKYFQRYKDPRNITEYAVQKFLSKNFELNQYVEDILKQTPQYETKRNIIICIRFPEISLKRCKICGKLMSFSKIKLSHCSSKCSNSDPEVIKKKEEKFLEHFGQTYNFKTKEFKQTSKQTSLRKYGVEHPLQNPQIYQKVKQTCLEKYGAEYLQQSKEIQEKSKEVLKRKYGVENIMHLHLIETIKSWKDYIVPLFDFKQIGHLNGIYKWKCVKCGNQFEQMIYKTNHIKQYPTLPRCMNCYPFISGYSYKEKELVDFCRQYFPNLIQNDHELIKPYQIDVRIDQIKLCLEFDGLYWHQIQKVGEGYHLMKTCMCNHKGYRLIHIWEDEWNDETKQRLKLILLNKEEIDLNQKLDRSWFNNLNGNFEYFEPQVILRGKHHIENCGYLKLK